MDKMREEFEEWAASSGYSLKMVAQPAAEYCLQISIYANGQTRSAWQAWQASRQSLVVELPRSFKDMYDQYVYDEQSIKDALDNAGIKWAE